MTTSDLGADSVSGIRQSGERASSPRNAPARDAGAREAKANTTGFMDTIRDRKTWVREPEIWEHDRPAVQRIWWWAAYGKQAGEEGWARRICLVYGALVAVPANTVAYLLAAPLTRLSGVECALDIASADRPRIELLWTAVREQHRDGAPTWRTGISVAALALVAVLYQAAWITARLTRLFAAGMNYLVLAHTIGLWPF